MSVFFALCAALGTLQFAENIKLLLQKGEQLLFDKAFSVIEFLWLLVVFWFLTDGGISTYGYSACGVFVAYHVFGWLVGIQSVKLARDNDSNTIVIPTWYFKINLAISLTFVVLSTLTVVSEKI